MLCARCCPNRTVCFGNYIAADNMQSDRVVSSFFSPVVFLFQKRFACICLANRTITVIVPEQNAGADMRGNWMKLARARNQRFMLSITFQRNGSVCHAHAEILRGHLVKVCDGPARSNLLPRSEPFKLKFLAQHHLFYARINCALARQFGASEQASETLRRRLCSRVPRFRARTRRVHFWHGLKQ